MTHIALVIPGLDRIGGAERQVMLLAKGLRQRGWLVSVVTLSGHGGAAAAELTDKGVELLSLGMRKGLADPRGWIRMNRWLLRTKPAVTHAHLPHAAWMVRWTIFSLRAGFSLQTGVGTSLPLVVDTVHSSATGTAGRRLGYRFSSWIPDCVTAVSEAAAETHLLAGMVAPGRFSVLPNGVDVDLWRPDAAARTMVRSELGLKDEFLWLAAGRLEPVKDYPTLLEAMAQLPETARLLIAGSGPLQEELTGLSVRLGLGTRIRFLGFEPELQRWMQAADGFVLSSRWEGLPMGLLEAGACGLPAVATDAAGTREVVVDGVTGRLVPVGDAAGLADAMRETMFAPVEERRAMGARARDRVAEEFSMESVLDRWEGLYRDLLTRRRVAAD